MNNRIIIELAKNAPKVALHRKVFLADKKKFHRISKQSVRMPLLFGLCIDGLENWNPEGFKLEVTTEPETKFLYEVYESDIQRLDEICKREGFKQIPFKYLFREIVKSLEI